MFKITLWNKFTKKKNQKQNKTKQKHKGTCCH